MAAMVPPNVMAALKDAKARLRAAFGERLVSVKLFGSYARGEATERSDVDVLVVLDEVHGHAERNAASGCVCDATCEAELFAPTIVWSVADLQRRRGLEMLLVANIDRDGIEI
jgi:hypothetical protein